MPKDSANSLQPEIEQASIELLAGRQPRIPFRIAASHAARPIVKDGKIMWNDHEAELDP